MLVGSLCAVCVQRMTQNEPNKGILGARKFDKHKPILTRLGDGLPRCYAGGCQERRLLRHSLRCAAPFHFDTLQVPPLGGAGGVRLRVEEQSRAVLAQLDQDDLGPHGSDQVTNSAEIDLWGQ